MSSHATEEPQGAGTVGAEMGAGYPCVMRASVNMAGFSGAAVGE